jgi:hypothetical protein
MGCCVSCEKGAGGEGEGERKKDPAEKQSQIAPTASPSGHMRANLLHSCSSCSRSHSRALTPAWHRIVLCRFSASASAVEVACYGARDSFLVL